LKSVNLVKTTFAEKANPLMSYSSFRTACSCMYRKRYIFTLKCTDSWRTVL